MDALINQFLENGLNSISLQTLLSAVLIAVVRRLRVGLLVVVLRVLVHAVTASEDSYNNCYRILPGFSGDTIPDSNPDLGS